MWIYSETCVRKLPLRLTLVVGVERWLPYKDTCHENYMTCAFIRQTPFPHQPLFKVSLKGGSLTQVSLYLLIRSCETYIEMYSLSRKMTINVYLSLYSMYFA